MKKRIIQFLTTYFLFVLLFVLQKPVFMVYYHDLYADVSFGDYFSVMWHGLPLDLSLAGYLTAIPGLILSLPPGRIRLYSAASGKSISD